MTESSKAKYSEKITNKRILFYTLSGPISGLLFGFWGNIQFFAASLLLIPQFTITLIYLIYSIVDSSNDPILGYLTDRSKRYTAKYGKRFPWIMIGVVGGPIFLILCFVQVAVIKVDINGVVQNPEAVILTSVWLIIIMCTYETFMTLYEVSNSALYPDLFREQYQRRKVNAYSGIIGGIVTIVQAIFFPIIIAVFGGETSKTAFLGAVIIVVVIAYLLVLLYSKGVRESKEMKAFRVELDNAGKSTSSVNEIVVRVFKDKNWMAIVIAFFCWSIAGACIMMGLNFFVVHNLGLGIGYTAFPLLAASVVGVVFAPIWMKIAKKIGVRKAYLFSIILNSVMYFLIFFVKDIVGLTLVYAFGGIGISANYGVIFGLATAEAIDNAALKSGKREEGSYFGILRIFSAYSYVIQAFIFATVSSFTGYNAAFGANQTDLAKLGLNIQMSLIPMVINIIGVIFLVLMYKISKADAEANKEKLIEMGL